MKKTISKIAGSSYMRHKYWARLWGRLLTFLLTVWAYLAKPEMFLLLREPNLFHHLSILHVLWVIWIADMLLQLRPARAVMALGSQKTFGRYYVPSSRSDVQEALSRYIRQSNRGALKVFVVWGLVAAVIGFLTHFGIYGEAEIFLSVVFFYLCDLICVLIWCPFRVFLMKNRCCSTCRIFNWDHLMMFIPFAFLPGSYGWSLLGLSILVFAVWEITFLLHPERFWDGTNQAIRCNHCTDRLCGKK